VKYYLGVVSLRRLGTHQGDTNEHLDDLIRGSASSMDWRIDRVPRSRRADPPVACIRGDLTNFTFCARQTDCLRWTRRSSPLSFRRDDYSDVLSSIASTSVSCLL
jgi:hypothetical protein